MPFDALTEQRVRFHPVVQLLIDARRGIENELHWCKNSYRMPTGEVCAVGSLRRLVGFDVNVYNRRYAQAMKLLTTYAKELGFGAFEALNDHCTHAEILAAMDDVIALAKLKYRT